MRIGYKLGFFDIQTPVGVEQTFCRLDIEYVGDEHIVRTQFQFPVDAALQNQRHFGDQRSVDFSAATGVKLQRLNLSTLRPETTPQRSSFSTISALGRLTVKSPIVAIAP